ncbi:MAG: uncharacterized protein K0R98_192 [Rickettsiaceae bacterium]|nr:uncharacterized protein [Rickettsiaceae bacterium]
MNSLIKAGKPFIIAFWHGRLLMMPPFAASHRAPIHVLISTHNDGELIAKVTQHFKVGVIRGSSKKEGLSAIRSVFRILKKNEIASITPDGPRGPRMRVSGTVIDLAKMAQVPIIPMTYSVSKCKIANSWDRFMIAKPFSKGIVIYSEPIFVDKDLTTEAMANIGLKLEKVLNDITIEADTAVGIVPVKPENLAA